ncbi:MAG: MFS transporter [Kutzneria sp.]|nr:MFS transporter [Kutzneria sp.]MBV9845192.1 MFS transporter [Kutzneria sp.]
MPVRILDVFVSKAYVPGVRSRITIAVAAAGIAAFALLYAPQPVLPQLAAQFDTSPGGASLAVSTATGALAVMVLPLATLSQFVDRRWVIVVSLLVAVAAGAALPLASTFPAFLGLRVVQGAAIAGLPATAMAYLADRLGGTGLGAAIGAMVAGNSMGGMAGRLTAGFSTDEMGWRAGIGCVTAFAALAAAVTVITLPAGPRPVRGPAFAGIHAALRTPILLAQYAIAALAMGSFVALYNAIGFRLTLRPLSVPQGPASLIFLAYLVGGICSATAGRLADRAGRVPVLLGGLLFAALGALGTLPDSVLAVALGLGVFTGGFFAAHSVASGWVSAAAPPTARGQAAGLYQCAFYVGGSIGGTAGTAVFAHAGWTALVAVVLCWLALAAAAAVAARAGAAALDQSWSAGGRHPRRRPGVERCGGPRQPQQAERPELDRDRDGHDGLLGNASRR